MSLQRMRWPLLPMADPPRGRIPENRIQAAETITTIVWLLYQLLQDIIKEVFINGGLIDVSVSHRWLRTSCVDPFVNHAPDIIQLLALNRWWGRMKIQVERTKYIQACIMNWMIYVSCIALILCSNSWTKLWQDPKLGYCPDWQMLVKGCHG